MTPHYNVMGVVLLLMIGLGLAAAPAPAATEGSEPMLRSPDNVDLYDFNDHSAIWGRGFELGLPEGATVHTIRAACDQQAVEDGVEVTLLDCFLPYITRVYWTDESGNPIGAPQVPTIPVPRPVLRGGQQNVVLKVGDFIVLDDVDCNLFGCNKNIDGYVVFKWFEGLGGPIHQSPQLNCLDQDIDQGDCDRTHQIISVVDFLPGQDQDLGHVYYVEFWDDDANDDNMADISIRACCRDVEVHQRILNNHWWGDEDNNDSPAGVRCHDIGDNSFCQLDGSQEAGRENADEDDAKLQFTPDILGDVGGGIG
jgi:hypothetical protein